MEEEWILLSEYCDCSNAEQHFINALHEEGLISITLRDQNEYLHESQLSDLELFTRLYYELSVNIEGIDIIHNLLSQMDEISQELNMLRRQFYEV